jgi:hypothetical protein
MQRPICMSGPTRPAVKNTAHTHNRLCGTHRLAAPACLIQHSRAELVCCLCVVARTPFIDMLFCCCRVYTCCCACSDNVDLGTACGKLFRVSVLAITDPGDSDIIKTTEA